MPTERVDVEYHGQRISYLTAGHGPTLLMLHGTFWSRVWEPVMGAVADAGWRALAPDFPGFGCSGGELDEAAAAAPALARWAAGFCEQLTGHPASAVAGHDIGGAVAQHLAVDAGSPPQALLLMNSVLYDSWPVEAVARFRDPEVRAATGPEELLQGRRRSLRRAIAGELDAAQERAWLAPWEQPARTRSWMNMAAAADARYTLDCLESLRAAAFPISLVWGEDDEFQSVTYAERLTRDIPRARLHRIAHAGHIPTADAPGEVAKAIGAALSSSPADR